MLWTEVSAECCKFTGRHFIAAAAGRDVCCGKGPCNIFCCNCDNGCRSDCTWDPLTEVKDFAKNPISIPGLTGRRKRANLMSSASAMQRFGAFGTAVRNS